MTLTPIPPATAPATATSPQARGLWQAAVALERQFLSEMLDAAGVGAPREAFGGGHGEAQFSSYLRDAQAGAMTEAGGIGLARVLYESLKERTDVAGL